MEAVPGEVWRDYIKCNIRGTYENHAMKYATFVPLCGAFGKPEQ